MQGNRPGLIRTDTLKKAIANGALLRSLADPAPYVVVTGSSPMPAGVAMLHAAGSCGTSPTWCACTTPRPPPASAAGSSPR